MSKGTMFCLIMGGFGSLFALIAWQTPLEKIKKSMLGYRERFLRLTWPVYPVLLVVGILRWIGER